MANQNPSRRRLLDMLARVAVAGQFPGFCKWTYAAAAADPAHHHAMDEGEPPTRAASYAPQFFSPAEYATIERLVEIIIPTDDTPGAKEAGVAEFIDFMVANDPTLTAPFRHGLKSLDQLASSTTGGAGGAEFIRLPQARQESLLSQLAYREQFQQGQEAGQKFFQLIRRYTVMGYYTSRVGLKALDYPGLKLYSSSPECPHVDDPEHKHLPPPRF